MKKLPCTILNLLVPGSGLIVARREWLALSLAFLYTVLAQIALVGVLIAPNLVPDWLIAVASGGAGLVWLLAQWLLLRAFRRLCDPATAAEVHSLRQRADQAAESGDYQNALQMLTLANELDDEDPETAVALARLLTRAGQSSKAQYAWHRLRRLDRTDRYSHEAAAALDHLSAI
jgi:hypothetical protein